MIINNGYNKGFFILPRKSFDHEHYLGLVVDVDTFFKEVCLTLYIGQRIFEIGYRLKDFDDINNDDDWGDIK